MKVLRSYKQRGTPDCPIALYPIRPGEKVIPYLHHHPELEFMFVFDGQVEYQLDQSVLHLTAGDIIAVTPNQIHGHISHTSDARFTRLIFSSDAIAMHAEHVLQKEFVQPLLNGQLLLPGLIQADHPAYDALFEVAEKLPLGTLNAPNWKLYRYMSVVSLCVIIAPWCIHLDEEMKDDLPGNKTVRKAMLYIHNRYELPIDLQSIAKHVHLHPNYLCALFKEHTGQTVTQYLTHRRVEAAIFLLQNSDLPMEQVAEKSGFRSQVVFYRHFREITGTTPKAFRRTSRSIIID